MCGIVGYVGKKDTVKVLLSGLTKLEYRGYDSAGIALNCPDEMKVFKTKGKLQNLKNLLKTQTFSNISAGIGHTRWATHGIPNEINAHPQCCNSGKIAVVHNGIIENFKELKKFLTAQGCVFKSQTDTESIAHLIALEYKKFGSFPRAVRAALKKLQGTYALCIMNHDIPGTIIVARKNAPLLIGLGKDENFVASDVTALIEYTKNAIFLNDDEVGIITQKNVTITDLDGATIDRKSEILPWKLDELSKMNYKHFMMKEINEQPDVIRDILCKHLKNVDSPVDLSEVKLNKNTLKNLKRIEIVGCGSSLYAAMVGKYVIEEFIKIPVEVESSSEYIYRQTCTNKNDLVIGVSQSGETADTLMAVRQAKKKGAHILIMTNRSDSTMARLADSIILLNAGIEVSVAATKSYSAQLLSFYLLAIFLAEIKNTLSKKYLKKLKQELILIPQKIEKILLKENQKGIIKCAKTFAKKKHFIYISRGINLATVFEGALKLKEITYIDATGYSGAELKHGAIAMLDDKMPVLAILMPGTVYDKILSNAQESKARNARLIAVTSAQDKELNDLFEFVLRVPAVPEILSPMLTVVVLQLFAYYIAEFLGRDIDQPRNLAKSVTVE